MEERCGPLGGRTASRLWASSEVGSPLSQPSSVSGGILYPSKCPEQGKLGKKGGSALPCPLQETAGVLVGRGAGGL